MSQLSENFHLREFTKSTIADMRGIVLSPDSRQIANIKHLCWEILEPIRILFDDKPIIITSGFRSEALNKIVGGSERSHHLAYEGYAACDFVIHGLDPVDITKRIIESDIKFHQVIACAKDGESGFVHVSSFRNKQEALKKLSSGRYIRFAHRP